MKALLLLLAPIVYGQSFEAEVGWPSMPFPAPGSTTVVSPPVALAAPAPVAWRYMVLAGGSYASTGSPKFGGIVSVCYYLSSSTCSYTTETFSIVAPKALANPTSSLALRTGIATQVFCIGQVCLVTLADAGGSSTGSGGIAGSFSGAGLLDWKPKWLTGVDIAFEVRITKTGADSSVGGSILIGKRL